jgi:Zn-dependent protease with chaperone function
MIPAHWFRRFIIFVFLLELGGGILWVTSRLFTDPAQQPYTQTISSIIFIMGFYSSGPLVARFLAPVPTSNTKLQQRLQQIVSELPLLPPVFLYDHSDKEANTVGLWFHQSRIYITSGLLTNMSDEGIKGILAHELTHVHERHIFIIFIYACLFLIASHYIQDNLIFLIGFLVLLLIRRFCEYRADRGASNIVGKKTMLLTLQELSLLYPTRFFQRFFVFASAYPTLSMRSMALTTGRSPLF